MKPSACILVALLTTAIAVPLENTEENVKGGRLFYRNRFNNRDTSSTVTTIEAQDQEPVLTDAKVPPIIEATDDVSATTETNVEDEVSDETEATPTMEQCCTGEGIHEQVHDHEHTEVNEEKQEPEVTPGTENQESDQEMETSDEVPASSQDSYQTVTPDVEMGKTPDLRDEIPVEEDAQDDEHETGISRDLKPPREGSSWIDFRPVDHDMEERKNPTEMEEDQETLVDEVVKKPVGTGKMFIRGVKGRFYS